MSILNFIPTIWAEGMIREQERAHRFVQDCERKYEGQLKKQGDKVVVPTLMTPDVTTIDLPAKGSDRLTKIAAPTALSDRGIEVMADKMTYFNFAVADIDRVQANQELMAEAQRQEAQKIANEHDKLVANLAASSEATKMFTGPKQVVSGTAGEGEINVLYLLDLAAQKLYENDVPDSETIIATIPPRFHTLIKQKYLELDTDNSDMMKNGMIGKYGNIIIRLSNNVHNGGTSSAPQDNIMIRTKDAIAFVEQLNDIEAYRPQDMVGADAVKGASVYGTKIIRPKKLVVANITY